MATAPPSRSSRDPVKLKGVPQARPPCREHDERNLERRPFLINELECPKYWNYPMFQRSSVPIPVNQAEDSQFLMKDYLKIPANLIPQNHLRFCKVRWRSCPSNALS